MAERFPLMDIRDMHLIERNIDSGKGIPEGDAGMRQSAGIDDDGIDVFKPGLMDPVNQGAFMIALETGETGASLFSKRAYHGNDIIKGFFAIDVRFPHTQQVQVRTVEQKNIFSHGGEEIDFSVR